MHFKLTHLLITGEVAQMAVAVSGGRRSPGLGGTRCCFLAPRFWPAPARGRVAPVASQQRMLRVPAPCRTPGAAPVGSASPDAAPRSWLLPWQEGSGLRGAAAAAIPRLARCPASRCLSFPLEPQPDCEEQLRLCALNGSGWFLAAWVHVGEQSARAVGCEIAFLEAARGPGD